MSDQKEVASIKRPVSLILVGLFALGVFLAFPMEITIAFLVWGLTFITIGTCHTFYLTLKQEQRWRKLKEDTKGALWIWSVCLLSLVTLALGWFALTWPTMMIIDMIEDFYPFPPEHLAAIGLIKSVLGWFLILMALGLLLWAYVSSQRREDITYPAY